MKFKPPTVVFDLDGTLVDTAPDLVRATNHCLESLGQGPVPLSHIRSAVGHGARAMLEDGLAFHGRHADSDQLDQLLEQFIAFYSDNISVESRPFPGVRSAIEQLAAMGARLAVCTNKREDLSRKLLKELELDAYFHAIVGRNTLPVSKPDPGHLIGTVILADGDLGRAFMVGDSDVDIATAKKAGIPIVAVTFGYSREPVASLSPDATIDHFDQLLAVLNTMHARASAGG